MFKNSWDNTELFGHKSEGVFIQPMNVYSCQFPLHVREIVRCHTSKNFISLSILFKRYELSGLVWLIEEKGVIINEKGSKFICLWWLASLSLFELGVLKPNPRFMDDETCFKCNLS